MKKFLKLAAFVIVCVSLIISMIPSASAALAYVDEDFEGYSTGTMFTLGNSNFIGEIAEKDGNKYLKMVMNSDEDTGHFSWWYPGQSPEDASAGKICFSCDLTRCDWNTTMRIYSEDKSIDTPLDLMFLDVNKGEDGAQWFRYGYSPSAGDPTVDPDDDNPAIPVRLEPGNTYKVEFFIDMDNDTVYLYLDGEQLGSFDNFNQTRLDYIRIHMQLGTEYPSEWDVDNLYFGPYDEVGVVPASATPVEPDTEPPTSEDKQTEPKATEDNKQTEPKAGTADTQKPADSDSTRTESKFPTTAVIIIAAVVIAALAAFFILKGGKKK